MKVRFWGVRGSVPWAIPAAIGHGCNTPCLEISDERRPAKRWSSTPAPASSASARRSAESRGELPILLTHYHWDHLQGLPFLSQLYTPGWRTRILAPALESRARTGST